MTGTRRDKNLFVSEISAMASGGNDKSNTITQDILNKLDNSNKNTKNDNSNKNTKNDKTPTAPIIKNP